MFSSVFKMLISEIMSFLDVYPDLQIITLHLLVHVSLMTSPYTTPRMASGKRHFPRWLHQFSSFPLKSKRRKPKHWNMPPTGALELASCSEDYLKTVILLIIANYHIVKSIWLLHLGFMFRGSGCTACCFVNWKF